MPDSAREKYDRYGRRTIVALLAFGLVLLTVAISAATITLADISKDTDEVEETLKRQAAINRLATFNEQIAAGRRGFLLQPDPAFTRVVRQASADYLAEQAELQELVQGNGEQEVRIAQIEALDAQRSDLTDAMFSDPLRAFRTARNTDFSRDRGALITQEIRSLAEEMAAIEAAELVRYNRAQLGSLIQLYVVGGLALALLLAVMVAAVVLVLRYNRDLTRAQIQLRGANEGLENAVAKRTAELTRANEEIQRFAYIVSHDLRSPLVNVLGFTAELEQARSVLRAHLESLYEAQPELRDREAWLAVDEDLPEAVGFIRTSTEKMDRLINSILELSRQGRRTLSPERLDMKEVADSVVASLHQRTEEVGAKIEVRPLPPIESDRIAIEQILSNLIENALKYLSPDRPGEIVVEGSRRGNRVFIDVIDNGRGIAPKDHERIFDLFRRAGQQNMAGEGIGLANVRALVYRLGGSIEVESELDQGARFRLCLPAQFVATEQLA